MKNVSLSLLAACLVLVVTACQAQDSPTNNAAGGANGNDNTVTNSTPEVAGNTNTGILKSNNEKDRVIVINKDPNDPKRCEIPNVGNVTIALNKNKVKWIVENNCPAANTANIVLEGFKEIGGAGATDPFGNNACDNKFIFDPILSGDEGRLVSHTPKKKGTFKYDIKVVLPDGTVIAYLDPQVVVT